MQFNPQNLNFKKEYGNLSTNMLAQLINNIDENKNLDYEEEEEEIFQADTYSTYMPTKLKIGLKHPDQVVETSSLSSVLPPDITYYLSIPDQTIDEGKLSALQLEAIVYACQQHEIFLPNGHRAGFLIGDGAGVGKGRTVAGIIYENYLLGRKKAIWLSVSNDLKYDAERDLSDIGAKKINVYPLNKFKYGKIYSKENGKVKKGVIFATYSSLISESHSKIGQGKTRLSQILQWCGEDFDGVIIFDECHKAKNLCTNAGSNKSTKTGLKVLELQNKLPKARIVYASATGATEPKNMAYMVRLGLWGKGTSFKEFSDFISTVEKRGVGAMELVAIDMKLRGIYIARQLSFQGVQFRIEEIKLSKDFLKIYDDCVALWTDAKNKFERALELMEDENSIKKAVWAQFWAAHQRFFKYLCIASKVPHVVKTCKEALKNGETVVIGLQSTGEAKTLEQLEESGGELTDFVSTAKAVFQSLIEKHFPAPNRKKTLKLLGLDSNFFDSKDEKYSVRNSRKARHETQKKLKETFKNKKKVVIKDDDETSDDKTDESEQEDYLKEDIDFTLSEKSDNEEENSSGDSSFDSNDEADQTKEDSENEISDDFDSDFSDDEEPWDTFTKGKLDRKRKKQGQSNAKKKKITKEKNLTFGSEEARNACERMRDSILAKLDKLSDRLPSNTIDELIDQLGGSEMVAEMTGRKGRVISTDQGDVIYESRNDGDVSLEMLNIAEKNRFMNDEKQIAIISEAASSGISLHSDRRSKNKKRRVHITIELPWSADRAIQQFGRTHRSNQVNAPKYIFLISDLAGEQRFASIVAKRLESLGALTHGDRRATETRDLSKFNIDTKYARSALEIVMKTITDQESNSVKPPQDYDGDFFQDCKNSMIGVSLVSYDLASNTYNLEKDYQQLSKFLNRLLGMKVKVQNALFQYFTETMDAIIKQARRLGRYDQGIMDLTSEFGQMERLEHKTYLTRHSTGLTKIELHKIAVERGISWDKAVEINSQCKDKEEGFYILNSDHMVRKNIQLAVFDNSSRFNYSKNNYRIYKPNTGLQSKAESSSQLKEKGRKIDLNEAKEIWEDAYNKSENMCSHLMWYNSCRRKSANLECDVGLRKRYYYILSGSVLTVWSNIEKVVPHLQNKLQIVRLNSKDGLRVIGILIPPNTVLQLVKLLEENDKKFKEEKLKIQHLKEAFNDDTLSFSDSD
ncbi:hypothetical protein RND71_044107 [Anisodus tanguticus]|uniref:Uncharacterized protein n=1 Tax=Anisodus tanguticus TaxID=243964 RepID=A0AAE1QN72_9SOLA|nr:hypothetical protein RND71_044107 [Anisodus tanguticus]